MLLQRMPGGHLVAADDETAVALAKVKTGALLRAKVSQVRNYKFHRKWFALMEFAYDVWVETIPPIEHRGQAVQPNKERFRHDLIILAGYYTTTFNIKGDLRLEAKSISFGSMGQEEFEKLYSATINAVMSNILANSRITREDVDRHVATVLNFDQ